jgi:hypothetical protein
MRRPGDYKNVMFSTTVFDQEIERLLTGSPDRDGRFADVAAFVDMVRSHETIVPSDSAVNRLATEAAILVRVGRSSSAPPGAIPDRPRLRWRALRPQIATAALAVLILTGTTGVAVAANASAPGNDLYGLDRALERIGLGAGGGNERLEEAGQLLARGETRHALEHVTQALDAEDDEEAKAALASAIVPLVTAPAGDAAVNAQEVAELLTYIGENRGNGVGADGGEFGRGVAEIARGIATEEEIEVPAPSDSRAPGNQNKPDGAQGPANGMGSGNGASDNQRPGNDAGNTHGNDGEGNNPGMGSGDVDPPGNGNGNGNGNRNGNGNGNGPDADSPSVTAPVRGNRP